MIRLVLLLVALPLPVFLACNSHAFGDSPTTSSWWSLGKLERPELPLPKDQSWVKDPIDAFILATLEAKGLKPSGPADRRTLIRRATFDLHGLPPTPEEVGNFLRDPGPGAFAKVIDRLLSSPRYGERWGRYWLDVARYSDDQLDATHAVPLPNAFRYRD